MNGMQSQMTKLDFPKVKLQTTGFLVEGRISSFVSSPVGKYIPGRSEISDTQSISVSLRRISVTRTKNACALCE